MAQLSAAMRLRRPAALDLLGPGPFRWFISSSGFEDLGIHLRTAAISWIMLDLTGSALWVGVAAGIRVVPLMALGPFGGVVADLFPRRRVMMACQVVLGLLAAGIATAGLISGFAPWHMIVISLASASTGAFLGPAAWALIADLAPANRLSSANGMVSTSSSLAETIGPPLAGAIIAAMGGGMAFFVIAASYAAAASFLLRVPDGASRHAGATLRSALADLKAGARYVARTEPLPWTIPLLGITNLLAVAIFPLIPVYAKDVFHTGPLGFGVLSGAMGAGFLCAAAFMAAFGNYRRRGLTIVVGGIVWDACMVGFAFSNSFALSTALLFVQGLAGVCWFNAMMTIWQSSASPAMRGRVMAVFAMVDATFPLGWLVGGALGEYAGLRNALLISAACGTPVTLFLFALSPSLRRTTRPATA